MEQTYEGLGDLNTIVNDLLQQLRTSKGMGKASEDALLALNQIFEQTLVASLDIVDRGLVTKVIGQPSTRSFYRVDAISKTDSTYFCWNHYCSCKTFVFSVISKEEALMCKHLLAVHVADALSKFKTQELPDAELSSTLYHLSSSTK